MENVVSLKKIIANVRTYWWLCLLCVAAAAALVGFGTIRTYRQDVAACAKDNYVGSATLYLKSENEKDSNAYGALLNSTYVRDTINAHLIQEGLEEFTAATDEIRIQSMANSTAYGLTVLSVGRQRTEVIGRGYIAALTELATTQMQVQTALLSELTVKPCIRYADGSFQSVEEESQRVVTLSAKSFLSWRKLVVVAAGLFLGIAVIFVASLFDEKIRSEEELADRMPGVYFGEIRQKEDIGCLEKRMEAFVGQEALERVRLIPLHHAVPEKMGFVWADSRIQPGQNLEEEGDGYIFAVAVNKDVIRDVRQAVNLARVLHRNIIGYIMV